MAVDAGATQGIFPLFFDFDKATQWEQVDAGSSVPDRWIAHEECLEKGPFTEKSQGGKKQRPFIIDLLWGLWGVIGEVPSSIEDFSVTMVVEGLLIATIYEFGSKRNSPDAMQSLVYAPRSTGFIRVLSK